MILNEAQIEPGLRVYAVGDIHGCLTQLDDLLLRIERDLAECKVERHKIIFLGDYVDRGPENKCVLDRLLGLKNANSEFVFLMGNHDERMVKFIEQPKLVWDDMMKWGGVQTLGSYGVVARPGESEDSVSKRFVAAVPDEHLEFLKSLEFKHIEDDYFFCHAGVRPGVQLADQADHDLIWIRDDFRYHEGAFEKVIIHGHTPQEAPEVKSNRVNVDTYCYKTGVLTAVVLEQTSYRFLQTV